MGAIPATPSRMETSSQMDDDNLSSPNVPMHLCIGPLLSKQTSENEESTKIVEILSILPEFQTFRSLENTMLDESRETPSWNQPPTQKIFYIRQPQEQKFYLKKNRKSSKSKTRKQSKKSNCKIDLDSIF